MEEGGVYPALLLLAISLNPELELVVDDCHLYSRVPVLPEAPAELVNADGVVLIHIVCAAVIVPADVGLTQFENAATPAE